MNSNAKTAMQNNLKYIFFGTPDFAAVVLEELIAAGMAPVAVVTNPDRPAGRKKELTAPSVKLKTINSKLGIPILQPEKLDDAFISELKKLNAEVGVLAAYGKIIPRAVFDIFPKGIVVVHPSLLPKYRGATPIQSAILAGEDLTGTTLFVMDEKVDHGPVLGSAQVSLMDTDTYLTLADKLAEASAALLIETLPKYVVGETIPVAQNETGATYTKKFTSEDAHVSSGMEGAVATWRKIRALNPEPGTWLIKDGKRMKILAADLVGGNLSLTRTQFDGELPKDMPFA